MTSMNRTGRRLLGRIRRSNRVTDTTISVEVQRQAILRYAALNGDEIVAWAEDTAVSRAVNPLEAPKLGPWMTDPEMRDSYDGVVAYRLDRLAAGSINLNKLMEWGRTYDKDVLSTSENFDLRDRNGQLMATMIAWVAEGELEAARERNTGRWDYFYSKGLFAGGTVLYGYRIGDNGEYLVDPEARDVLMEIVARIIGDHPASDGPESVRKVRIDLNERGVMSPTDRQRVLHGNEPNGTQWGDVAIKDMLTSEALLGYALRRDIVTGRDGKPIYDGRGKKQYGDLYVVRDEEGAPIQRGEPLMSRTRFIKLQEALSKRTKQAGIRRDPQAVPLSLGVLRCQCEQPFYRNKGASTRYLRCGSYKLGKKGRCGTPSVREEVFDAELQRVLMHLYGDREMVKRIYVPASDNVDRLAEVEAQIDNIASLITSPAFRGEQRAKMESQLAALAEERDTLEQTPVTESGYRYEPTGQTVRQHWDLLSPEQRNSFLRNSQVSAVWDGATISVRVDPLSVLNMTQPQAAQELADEREAQSAKDRDASIARTIEELSRL